MNTHELRIDATSRPTVRTDPDPTEGPPLCGSDTTPKCPAKIVYKKRDDLIEQIAGGPGAAAGRRQEATKRVDNYLFGVLQSALELTSAPVPNDPEPALYELRAALIYQLAGTQTDLELVQEAIERVDDYLLGVLQSALGLTRPLSGRSHTAPA